jgi:hypothetical protein
LEADVPPDQQVADALLWYDTEFGRQAHHFAGPLPPDVSLSYELDAEREALTTDAATGELDYWWLVRDTSGESARAGGTVLLEPALQARAIVPEPSPRAIDFTWAVSESQHYQFHFAPGSAAERDLAHIGAMAEAALARTRETLEVEFHGTMSVYLVPRIFWQGAATYGDKVQLVSYLDRNYTAVETWSYFAHEGTHALAQDLARPPEQPEDDGSPDGILLEGLAVWASDGHYRREPLDTWAAVLATSDEYIPLAVLRAGPFYGFQHEISYLEAASFVKFLIEQHGLDRFKELYRLATGEAAHDDALVQRLYDQGYDQLEAGWLDYLASLEPTPQEVATWHLTRRSFDLMRRYETEMDPDARILPSSAPSEWTTDTLEIFMQRLHEPANVVLETALISAQERLHGGDPAGAAQRLDDVEAALDAHRSGVDAHWGRTDAHRSGTDADEAKEDPGESGEDTPRSGTADQERGEGASRHGEELTQPSLKARMTILEQVAAQDRAVLHADARAYLSTVSLDSTLATESEIESRLRPPFTTYRQEVVRLEVNTEGLSASGAVMVHAQLLDTASAWGQTVTGEALDEDGQLFAVTFARTQDRWLMTNRWPIDPVLAPVPPSAPSSQSD